MLKNFGQEVESKVTTIEERKSQRNKIPNLIVEMKEKRVDIQREFLLFSLFYPKSKIKGKPVIIDNGCKLFRMS